MRDYKLIFFVALVFLFVGCSDSKEVQNMEDNRIKVVTTLFPQYDFARVLGDGFVDVSLLLPPGVEAHSYEPTPRDIIAIEKADLFIYTGEFMEPWVDKVLKSIKNPDLVVIDVSQRLDLRVLEDEDKHEEADDSDHAHEGVDPHIWLDPVYVLEIVDQVKEGLEAVDEGHKPQYEENAQVYKEQLIVMNQKFEEAIHNSKSKTILVGGHFAFGYLADRYGLEYISVYKGFSPDAEPTPKRVAELIDQVKELNLKYIYHEELVDPKVAKIIADETGAKLLLLHAAHNLSKEEFDSGLTFLEIMEMNLKNLTMGLESDE